MRIDCSIDHTDSRYRLEIARRDILDLGCGPGRDLRIFADRGHRPIGLELNLEFVGMARQNGDVVAGDIARCRACSYPRPSTACGRRRRWSNTTLDETSQVLVDLRGLLVHEPGDVCDRGLGHGESLREGHDIDGWASSTASRDATTVGGTRTPCAGSSRLCPSSSRAQVVQRER